MAAYLPVELVGEIWRAAAELFIETEHRTVLNIAASCTIGYHAATPVLYRTLLMTDRGAELAMRVFNTEFTSNVSKLSAPPAQRLCPLVRRLCAMRVPDGFTADDLQHLTGLEMICDPDLLEAFLLTPQAPTPTHFFRYTTEWPGRLPPTITHVSMFSSGETREQMKAFIDNTLPEMATHLALSFRDTLEHEGIPELVGLLQVIVARRFSAPAAIWLLGDAAEEASHRSMLRAIAALGLDDQSAVRIWRDLRPAFLESTEEIMVAAEMDFVAGRTPWTEAESVTQEELIAATTEHDREVDP